MSYREYMPWRYLPSIIKIMNKFYKITKDKIKGVNDRQQVVFKKIRR
jgi:hypothetical protein